MNQWLWGVFSSFPCLSNCFQTIGDLCVGRDIDSDGVSFGDFGVVRAGGREESRKLKVDQDLMDTWYPDCRDCPCCKVGSINPRTFCWSRGDELVEVLLGALLTCQKNISSTRCVERSALAFLFYAGLHSFGLKPGMRVLNICDGCGLTSYWLLCRG